MPGEQYSPMSRGVAEAELEAQTETDDRLRPGPRSLVLGCALAAGLLGCATLLASGSAPFGTMDRSGLVSMSKDPWDAELEDSKPSTHSKNSKHHGTHSKHSKRSKKVEKQDDVRALLEADFDSWRTVWIKPKSNRHLCLVVAGGLDHNGNVAQLSKCDDKDENMQFYLPKEDTKGDIKWSAHPKKCLDAPDGEVMWWNCEKSKSEQQTFNFPDGREGVISLFANSDQCIAVPSDLGEKDGSETFLQLGGCTEDEAQFVFEHVPASCKYSLWSEWGACSDKCGGGISMRSRSVLQESEDGEECDGRFDLKRCNTDRCPPRASALEAPKATKVKA